MRSFAKDYLPFPKLLIDIFIYHTCQETGARIRICGIKAGTGEKVIPLTHKFIIWYTPAIQSGCHLVLIFYSCCKVNQDHIFRKWANYVSQRRKIFLALSIEYQPLFPLQVEM